MTDHIKSKENAKRGEPHWEASGLKVSKGRLSNMDGLYAALTPKWEFNGRKLTLEAKYIKNGYADLHPFTHKMFMKLSLTETIFVLWGTIDEGAYDRSNGDLVKYIFTKIRVYHNGKIILDKDEIDIEFINKQINKWETWAQKNSYGTHADIAAYHIEHADIDELQKLQQQVAQRITAIRTIEESVFES